MGNYRLVIYIQLFCAIHRVSSIVNDRLNVSFFFAKIIIIDDDMNSTNDEYIKSTQNSLPIWLHQQIIICIISVSLGTLLVFVTFIVPAVIIIRRIRRDRHPLDFKELRRISDFI
jgi:hypothetical protein